MATCGCGCAFPRARPSSSSTTAAPVGFFSYLLIAVVALWQGLDLAPTLVNGYVLVDLPAAVARAATVACLGCAIGLALLVFRLDDLDEIRSRRRRARTSASPNSRPRVAQDAR